MTHDPGRRRRITYIGDLRHGGTCRERMLALAELGHDIVPVDLRTYYTRANVLARALAGRFRWGPVLAAFNRDLQVLAREQRTDWAWVDKGVWVYPETLTAFREAGNRLLIHYTPDPAILFHHSRHFLRGLPMYDVVVTNKRYELDLYRRHGARHVIWSCTAFSQGIFRPVELTPEDHARYDCNVVFVGHCEPHYVRRVAAAARAVEGVAVWGRWERALAANPWLRGVWRGPGVWHEEYLKSLKCARIGLGLLTRLAPDKATTRSMEIPAAGTFMLAERTEEHQALFEEDVEAVYFDSDEEMADKLRFYLGHDELRQQIAAAGHRRCMTSGYSYQDRVRQLVDQILESHDPCSVAARGRLGAASPN